jgi:short-subunit dehydrogenase involved in D-alanine esterification of teichoic acids
MGGHTMKKNPYHFKDRKEFNEAVNRKFKPLLDAEIEKYNATLKEEIKKIKMQELIETILPVISTTLYETYKFADKKQEPFMQKLVDNIQECINQGIFDTEEYKEFCKQKNKRYFDMEVVE